MLVYKYANTLNCFAIIPAATCFVVNKGNKPPSLKGEQPSSHILYSYCIIEVDFMNVIEEYIGIVSLELHYQYFECYLLCKWALKYIYAMIDICLIDHRCHGHQPWEQLNEGCAGFSPPTRPKPATPHPGQVPEQRIHIVQLLQKFTTHSQRSLPAFRSLHVYNTFTTYWLSKETRKELFPNSVFARKMST